MTGTVAVGYEFVYAIGRESYVITEDAKGVSYAFEMDDETRRRLAACVEEVLDYPETVALLEIEPGYLRIRVDPSALLDLPAPKAYHELLRRVPAVYNELYATEDSLDGLLFDDWYAGVYRPDDVDTSLEADTGEEPLVSIDAGGDPYTRDGMDYTVRVRVAFEPLAWDDHERDRIRKRVAGRRHNWPGSLERFELYSEYAVAVCSNLGRAAPPDGIAEGARRAFETYNRGPQFYETERNHPQRFPELELHGTADVEAVESADNADAWIESHNLEDVDGEPVEPEPAPGADEEDDASGWTSRINPFGGAS